MSTMAPLAPNRLRHRGMNFAEVLFAVMILGIGFIMVAAIFPVAIQQSRSSVEETISVGIAKSALATIEVNATEANLPATDEDGPPADLDNAVIAPFGPTSPAGQPGDAIWKVIKGDTISRLDERFGFAALYRRVPTQKVAQVFIIPMQVQNRSRYNSDPSTGDIPRETFVPLRVNVTLYDNGAFGDRLVFDPADHYNAAAEGAVVIIGGASGSAKHLNGRILRLGRRIDPMTWELDVSSGIDATYPSPIPAYLVGRGIDPVTNAYTGANQAISVMTTIVPIRP